MLISTTDSGDAMLVLDRAGDVLGNQGAPPVLETFHAKGEPFALEVVSIDDQLRFYVRTRLARDADLRTMFVPSSGDPTVDWLHLDKTRSALYRVLHLREHALLPTFGLLNPEIIKEREAFGTAMTQHTGKHGAQRLAIRILLQAAPDGWEQGFLESFRTGAAPPKRGFLQRFVESGSRPHDANETFVNVKCTQLGFSCDIQVVVVCKDDSRENSIAQSALDNLAALVLDTVGGDKAWERSGRKKIRGARIRRDNRNGHKWALEPWPLLEFETGGRARRFALTADELIPLWPAPLSRPTPAPVKILSPPAPAREQPPVVGTGDSCPDPSPAYEAPEPVTAGLDVDAGAAPTREQPAGSQSDSRPGASSQDDAPEPKTAGPDEGADSDRRGEAAFDVVGPEAVCGAETDIPFRGARPRVVSRRREHQVDSPFHSARPRGLPSTRGVKREGHRSRRSTKNRGTARTEEALGSARTEVINQLGLADRHVLAFHQLGDLPWSSALEFAGCFGRAPSTAYDVLGFLRQRDLVANRSIDIGASEEKRFWIPEAAWDLVTDHEPLPHGGETVRRLRLNPEFTAAVYLLTGAMARGELQGQLLRFRWLWDQPFNAGAQFNDGWAGFLWSGIWEDGPALRRRLDRCLTVFDRWGGHQTRCRPGRLIWVVPTRWQSERVWRTVRDSEWEKHSAVYVVEEDELVGDLDLSASLGIMPPFIMTEKLKPLPKYVDRYLDILAGEQPARLRRLVATIERSRAISHAALQEFTRMNGSNLNEALSILGGPKQLDATSEGDPRAIKNQDAGGQRAGRDLIRVLPNGMYIPGKAALSLAAHRDGVRPTVPGSRCNPDHVGRFSDRQFTKLETTNSLLARFASAGCPVVSGFFCSDGGFKPDGAVWIDEGLYGSGWHCLVNALGARQRTSVARALRGVLSRDRRDDYPILVLCRSDTEGLIWEWGRDRQMLTVTPGRLRGRPVVGHPGVWFQYGHPVNILNAPRTADRGEHDDCQE